MRKKKDIANYEKDELVARIIVRRGFDVPNAFVEKYINNQVFDILATKLGCYDNYAMINTPELKNNIFNYSSVANAKGILKERFDTVIENYKNFIHWVRITNDSKSKKQRVNFCRKGFLQNLNILAVILTLQTNSEWKAYLKMKSHLLQDRLNFLSFLSLLISYMMDLKKWIPREIVSEILNPDNLMSMRDLIFLNSISLDDVGYVIRCADVRYYMISSNNATFVIMYLSCGGTYFPESTEFITFLTNLPSKGISAAKVMELYDNNVRSKHTIHTFGYYCAQYILELQPHVGFHVNTLLQKYDSLFVLDYDYIHRYTNEFAPDIVVHILRDLLEYDVPLDVNTLNYIRLLPHSTVCRNRITREMETMCKVYNYDTYQNQQYDITPFLTHLICDSDVPLRNIFTLQGILQRPLTGNSIIQSFINRGGNPNSIPLHGNANTSNVLYTKTMILSIIRCTSDKDLYHLILADDKFVSQLENYIVREHAASTLNTNDVTRLLEVMITIPINSQSIHNIINYLLSMLGENIPMSCVEYYATRPYVQADYMIMKKIIRNLGFECFEHIPVYLLSEDDIDYQMRMTKNSSNFFKLNTTTANLDDIFTEDKLYHLIVEQKLYAYIPDLSESVWDEYIEMSI